VPDNPGSTSEKKIDVIKEKIGSLSEGAKKKWQKLSPEERAALIESALKVA